MSTILAILSALVIMVIYLLIVDAAQKENNKYIIISANPQKGKATAILVMRGERCSMLLHRKPHFTYYEKYHEASINYYGATVGGIHMGEAKVEGPYRSMEAMKTDKYIIAVKAKDYTNNKKVYCHLEKIKLDNEILIDEAKNDPYISRYLVKDTLFLKNITNYDYNVPGADMDTAMTMAKMKNYSEALTKEDCDKIINWLSNSQSYTQINN